MNNMGFSKMRSPAHLLGFFFDFDFFTALIFAARCCGGLLADSSVTW
jgi:hypothetical protein